MNTTQMIHGFMVWECFRNGGMKTLEMFRSRSEAEAFVTARQGSGRYFQVERHHNKNRFVYGGAK